MSRLEKSYLRCVIVTHNSTNLVTVSQIGDDSQTKHRVEKCTMLTTLTAELSKILMSVYIVNKTQSKVIVL